MFFFFDAAARWRYRSIHKLCMISFDFVVELEYAVFLVFWIILTLLLLARVLDIILHTYSTLPPPLSHSAVHYSAVQYS